MKDDWWGKLSGKPERYSSDDQDKVWTKKNWFFRVRLAVAATKERKIDMINDGKEEEKERRFLTKFIRTGRWTLTSMSSTLDNIDTVKMFYYFDFKKYMITLFGILVGDCLWKISFPVYLN